MGTITLSVPDELKLDMSKTDWVNWSSVARHAFAETLKDVKKLQLMKKVREISEIAEDDTREVKESLAKEIVESSNRIATELKSGKRKAMSRKGFNRWCEEL